MNQLNIVINGKTAPQRAREQFEICAQTNNRAVIRPAMNFQLPLVACLNNKPCEFKLENRARNICTAVWEM